MRIVVNDIAASTTGAMTILKQFYNYILENDTENEWIFFLGDRYLEETGKIKIICFPEIKASRVRKVLFDCFYGRKVVETYQPDVVVSLQNIITFGVKVPQVLYVHQSLPFQTIRKFSFLKRDERSIALVQHFIGAFIKASIKKADAVFVQTKWMQEAVSRSTGIPLQNVFAAFPQFDLYEADMTKFNRKCFFYPTAGSVYKNNNLIVEACNLLNADGIEDFEVRLTLPHGSIKHRNITCVGHLNRTQMQEEYQSGTLVFPSYIETVGLPLLEARSCQTIILAANTPFSRECLERYPNVCYFDPFDVNVLKEQMKAVMNGHYSLKPDIELYESKPGWKEFYEEILSCKKIL